MWGQYSPALSTGLIAWFLPFTPPILDPYPSQVGGSWKGTGPLATERTAHTATLMLNGKVLAAGGYNSASGYLAGAEIYDPAAGTWAGGGSLIPARGFHTATLLLSGRVLVAGGCNNT